MSPWQEWKKKNAERQASGKVSPVDFANPDTEYAAIEESDSRLETCETCPHFMASKQCSKCGCFMPLKVKLLHASCPIEKW